MFGRNLKSEYLPIVFVNDKDFVFRVWLSAGKKKQSKANHTERIVNQNHTATDTEPHFTWTQEKKRLKSPEKKHRQVP